MKLQRPQAFAGLLIVGLVALVGFAAFSVIGIGSPPPVDIPDDATARISGAVLGIDLGPDVDRPSLATEPETGAPGTPDSAPQSTESPAITTTVAPPESSAAP